MIKEYIKNLSKIKKVFLVLIILIFLVIIYVILQRPSLDRNWTTDQQIMADISFFWETANIKNIRNFKYSSTEDYEVVYYNKAYNLDEVESVYYIIEPFSDYDWPAHTMLSFGFQDWSYLVISAEIRKEKWESFSGFMWIMNQYEIVYVLWDENDLIKLRANYRKDEVFMYPIKTDKEKIKQLLESVLIRADKLSKEPEFYNTFTNTCATSILDHVNSIRENNDENIINWSRKVFLPSRSDTIAYDLWLINTNLSLKEAREYYKINELSEKFWNKEDYSKLIRKEIK